MKKWAVAAIVTLVAVIVVTAGAVALGGSTDKDEGARVSRDADGGGETDGGTNVAPVCAPDFPDCDDMMVNPDGDVADNPDEPVSSEPPISIIDDLDPNECSFVHNITACEKAAIALASEDLAKRLGSSNAITVESIEPVEWPEACLGIYQPNVACAEVITQGFRIVLRVDDQAFEYHTDAGTRALLVE